jgi:hypothetical protein
MKRGGGLKENPSGGDFFPFLFYPPQKEKKRLPVSSPDSWMRLSTDRILINMVLARYNVNRYKDYTLIINIVSRQNFFIRPSVPRLRNSLPHRVTDLL